MPFRLMGLKTLMLMKALLIYYQFLPIKLMVQKELVSLYARENVKLAPRSFGGEQERKRRAGTENVACLVGFHEAVSNCSSRTMR